MNTTRIFFLVLLVAGMHLSITGCAPKKVPPKDPPRLEENATVKAWEIQPVEEPKQEEQIPVQTPAMRDLLDELPSKAPKLRTGLMGQGQGLDPSSKAEGEPRTGILNFDNADIKEVVNQVFGEYLKVNYLVDPAVKGQISLHFEGEFTGDALLRVVTRALLTSNVDVVEEDGLYIIRPVKDGGTGIELGGKKSLFRGAAGPSVFVYRPRFIKADQAQKLIKFLIPRGRPVTVDDMTNSLIFVDNPSNARNVIGLLRALDVNVLEEIGMEIVPLQGLSPKDAVKSLESILTKLGVFKQSTMRENLAFIPLENFKGILILAQDPAMLSITKEWLIALDVQGMEMGEQVSVYHVENGLAKNIADILNQIFESGSGRKPGLEQHVVKSVPEGKEGTQVIQGSSISTELTGKVLIIPDETNNAIVIRANARDLAKVIKAVKALDILPRAVLIEVVIAEVDLTDELTYGVEWFLRNRKVIDGGGNEKGTVAFDTGVPFTTDFDLGDSAAGIGTIPTGLSFFLGSDNFAALLNLLDSNNNVNILSTPTLLAMDNTEASISVGGREPTISQSSQSTDDSSNIINEIKYEETGIILKVTPHINTGGMVRLEVDQNIRSVIDQQLSGVSLNTPRFSEREIKTSLMAQDGKTVVIGGIMQTKKTNIQTGVPILSDIPLLSFFFSKTEKKTEKTELIVAITPHVVQRDQIPIAREFLQKLEDLKKRIEEN